MGTLNVGTMDDKLADMMERRSVRRPGAPEADSNLGVEETWSRKKSDGIISLKPEIKELMLNVVIVCAQQGGCQEGKSGLVECVREVTGACWDRHVGE